MSAGQWRSMPLIPALGSQKQTDWYEFETSLVYKVSSRTATAVSQRNPVLKNKTKQNKNTCLMLNSPQHKYIKKYPIVLKS